MFRKILLAFVTLSFVACSSGGTAQPTPSANDIETEEEAVYAALIHAMYPAEMVVLMDQTQTDITDSALGETLQRVLQEMGTVSAETVDNFRVRNDRAYPLRLDMTLGVPYVLLSEDNMRQIFSENQNGWDVFYGRYPNAPGIITLSRVGFNAALDQALVYIGDQSHWLAGAGYYVLLKKVDGVWTNEQQVMNWIS